MLAILRTSLISQVTFHQFVLAHHSLGSEINPEVGIEQVPDFWGSFFNSFDTFCRPKSDDVRSNDN